MSEMETKRGTREDPGEMRVSVIDSGMPVEKAGGEGIASRKLPPDPFAANYGEGSIIQPPYDLTQLAGLLEQSTILPQCIEAMEVNVDGFGYVLEPLPWVEKDADGNYPAEAMAEKARLELFFDYCNPVLSYSQIRRRTRRDLEATGNGYWEVIRDGSGKIAGLEHLEAHTMRLAKLDAEPQTVRLQVTDANGKQAQEILCMKRFRRYVQERDGVRVWFKELGDPRRINSKDGKVMGEGEGSPEATEVLHWATYCPTSPYGVPRWLGSLLAILGSREADEVNLEYFGNKSIPPLALLVGGRLAADAVETIRNYIRDNIKGRKGFHSILVIQAEAGASNPVAPGLGAPKATLAFEKLTDAQQGDALFQNYDKANRDKVRSSFRLPPLYVGETTDYTRATANESQRVAEEQVFRPERDDHDFSINRRIMPLLGARFWWYRSNSPTTDDPTELTSMLKTFSESGMTVREARGLIGKIMNEEYPEPDGADWLDEPLSVYLEKLRLGASAEQGKNAEFSAVEKFTRVLTQVRGRVADAEDRVE